MAFLEYNPKSTLFHYCGAGGFEGITSGGSIWLSDLQNANDPKELQLAELLDQVMAEMIKKVSTSPGMAATYRHLQRRLRHLRKLFGKYSFSLSLRGDKLPMWQEYTDRGQGYCIGFRASAFNHMPLRIQRVNYVNPDYFEKLHTELERIAVPLSGYESDFVKEIETVTPLLSWITSIKDETWEHEQEVRLVFSSMVRPADFKGDDMWPVSMLRDGTMVLPENPLQRERGGQMIPYFAKPFGRMKAAEWDPSGAISLVIIGPNNSVPVDLVTNGLVSKGYHDFEVVKSRCAFRP